jgi:hypothetical protein
MVDHHQVYSNAAHPNGCLEARRRRKNGFNLRQQHDAEDLKKYFSRVTPDTVIDLDEALSAFRQLVNTINSLTTNRYLCVEGEQM